MSAKQAYHGKSVGGVAGTDHLGRATGPMTLEEIAGRFNPYRPAKNRPQPQDLALQTPAATPLSGYSKPPGLVLADSVGAKTQIRWAYCPGAPTVRIDHDGTTQGLPSAVLACKNGCPRSLLEARTGVAPAAPPAAFMGRTTKWTLLIRGQEGGLVVTFREMEGNHVQDH